MIDERYISPCDVFMCYRESSAETAKSIKTYMKNNPKKHFGRVWYSDDENIGNFKFDIKKHITSASSILLFLTPDFTTGFLTPDGRVNKYGYDMPDGHHYGECITVQEFIEIEVQRQNRNVRIICVNINQYHFSDRDLDILRTVFESEGIVVEDSIAFYKDLNRNDYMRRQTQLDSFAERLLKGTERKILETPEAASKSNRISFLDLFKPKNKGIDIITEETYKQLFNDFFKSGKYRLVKIFGYTGEVVSNDLITYADRYIDHIELRLLHRNPFVEASCEKEHNQKIRSTGLREWDKSAAILKMAVEKWTFQLKREIRYYSHQPIIKGAIFCDESHEPIIGFLNAIAWVPTPPEGGSQFKSVPSDMIHLTAKRSRQAQDVLQRFNQQFDYEWMHGTTQDQIRETLHGETHGQYEKQA